MSLHRREQRPVMQDMVKVSKTVAMRKSVSDELKRNKDQSRLRVVNDDGSLGVTVGWDDLTPVRELLRALIPVM